VPTYADPGAVARLVPSHRRKIPGPPKVRVLPSQVGQEHQVTHPFGVPGREVTASLAPEFHRSSRGDVWARGQEPRPDRSAVTRVEGHQASTSTPTPGIPTRRTSTKPRRRCSPWPPLLPTEPVSRNGSTRVNAGRKLRGGRRL